MALCRALFTNFGNHWVPNWTGLFSNRDFSAAIAISIPQNPKTPQEKFKYLRCNVQVALAGESEVVFDLSFQLSVIRRVIFVLHFLDDFLIFSRQAVSAANGQIIWLLVLNL